MSNSKKDPLGLIPQYKNLFSDFVTPLSNWLEAVPKVTPISDSLTTAVQKIQAAQLPLINFAEQFEKFSKSLLEGSLFFQTGKLIEDFLKYYHPYIIKAAAILTRYEWFLLDDFPIPFYVELVDNQNEITREELTAAIVEFFNRNNEELLTKVLEGWNLPYYRDRELVFKDALWAHKQKRYTLSIPALVFHVEGIIRDFMFQVYGTANYDFKKIRQDFKSKVDQLAVVPPNTPIVHEHVRQVQNYHNFLILENRLFSNFDPAKDSIPSWLNRHALEHGRVNSYATIEKSTWIFLLLDVLHSMLESL